MAKKKTSGQQAKSAKIDPTLIDRPAVTPERFRRLVRLITFLGEQPRKRDALTSHLDLDVRGFYRDLELLRQSGINVTLDRGLYTLSIQSDEALARLPFPDLFLTLGQARQLGVGKARLHEQVRKRIEELLG